MDTLPDWANEYIVGVPIIRPGKEMVKKKGSSKRVTLKQKYKVEKKVSPIVCCICMFSNPKLQSG